MRYGVLLISHGQRAIANAAAAGGGVCMALVDKCSHRSCDICERMSTRKNHASKQGTCLQMQI